MHAGPGLNIYGEIHAHIMSHYIEYTTIYIPYALSDLTAVHHLHFPDGSAYFIRSVVGNLPRPKVDAVC